MSRRRHPIHAVIERGQEREREREREPLPRNYSIDGWGYLTTDVGKEFPFSSITGKLSEGGEEAEKSYYQKCMVPLAEIDPMVREVERMDRERLQEELRQNISEYLHQTTRGDAARRRFDVHESGGTVLRRRIESNFQNVEFLPLGVHGMDRDGKSYQLHFIKKQHGYLGWLTYDRPMAMDEENATSWLNYAILRWRLVWLEEE